MLRRAPPRRAKPLRHTKTPDRRGWLRQALTECFGMDPADADAISGLVADTFGTDDEVSDDTLTTHLRSIFYTLETKRILTFRRFEYHDPEGRTLRGFQWRLNAKFEMPQPSTPTGPFESVYEELPASVWKRQAA